MFKYIVRLTDY